MLTDGPDWLCYLAGSSKSHCGTSICYWILAISSSSRQWQSFSNVGKTFCGIPPLHKHTMSCSYHEETSHTKHPENVLKQICYVCGFTTFFKSVLKNHMNHRHTPDERISCPHCTFRVKDRTVAGMEIHIDGSHSENYLRQFGCAHCSRMFVFDRSLDNHLYKHELRWRSCHFNRVSNDEFSVEF